MERKLESSSVLPVEKSHHEIGVDLLTYAINREEENIHIRLLRKMSFSASISNYINIFLLTLIILASTVYSIPVVVVRRLRNHPNILTVNWCLALGCLSVYWILLCLMSEHAFVFLYTSPTCTFFYYIQIMLVCQATYAFTITSVSRYFYVVCPNNRYAKSKQWLRSALCTQWFIGLILPLPIFARSLPVRVPPG